MDARESADRLLRSAREQVQRLQKDPGLGRIASGLPEHDLQLWRLGSSRIEAARDARRAPPPGETTPGDVFLATELYKGGGHTALIGDFVTALASARPDDPGPRLFLTDLFGRIALPIPESIRSRTCVPQESIHVLPGPSLAERLDQLITGLLDARPRRLFLFHHPEDPLASAVAHAAIAAQRLLVHHADATPSLGLHVPGVHLIELNPVAAAHARAQRMAADLLLLTCPDPGPRPHGFLSGGRLVTATCGNAVKYEHEYVHGYPDAVAAILGATHGTHVHIGRLSGDALAKIAAVLERAGLDQGGFVHRPWVPSLAEALWEHRCDVYIASFPVDGARAYLEVAASATPYLAHSRLPTATARPWTLGVKTAGVWHTFEDLAAILRSLADRNVLEASGRRIRDDYDAFHHPTIFRRTLLDILEGKGGIVDPDEGHRDELALRSLLGSLQAGLAEAATRLDRIAGESHAARQLAERKLDDIQRRLGEMEEKTKRKSRKRRIIDWLRRRR
jgi:hypothetical protein